VDTLIRFSRLASEASTGSQILPLLAEAAVRHLGADGAVVVEVTDDGRLRVAAAQDVPETVAQWAGESEAIDSELGPDLLRASDGKFADAQTFPLVSTGGLFGALVLLFRAKASTTERELGLARGLADLAAVAVGRASQMAKLEKTNAELRASRDVLARTEKLRALGQMAAGVSHDLKNILNPVSLHAQLIQRAIARGDTEAATRSVEELRGIIHRGVETLERLRAFSRQSPDARATRVQLEKLAAEALVIARPRMSSRSGALCRIVEELAEAPPVEARGDEVVAAVVNLLVNAMDAMPDGGTIHLRTGEARGGAFVTVADTGPGMTPDVQARIFEPFFTTKGREGTGLGLAMVFATMQRCGGSVSVESTPGQGAAFTLWFPALTA
jgi:signal transduction histidine kinase